MNDPTPLLLILEGLFYLNPSGNLVVLTPDKGEAFVSEYLKEGLEVSLSLSYDPARIQPGLPGLGVCVHPDTCPLHIRGASYLYSFSGEGVVFRTPQGNYLVGDAPTGIELRLPGHYGRLVLLRKTSFVETSWETLTEEASDMVELLKALHREMT